MKPVFHTLQRLRDQEKKEKQRLLAEAEALRRAEEEELSRLHHQLQEERSVQTKTAGEMILQDRLVVTRFFEMVASEQRLEEKSEKVEHCQEELLFARQKSRIMEELILSMETKEGLERKRKQDKITDEIGVMAWQRRREEL